MHSVTDARAEFIKSLNNNVAPSELVDGTLEGLNSSFEALRTFIFSVQDVNRADFETWNELYRLVNNIEAGFGIARNLPWDGLDPIPGSIQVNAEGVDQQN